MTLQTAQPIGRDGESHAHLVFIFCSPHNALSDKCRKTSYKNAYGIVRMNNARLPFEQSGEELKLQRGEKLRTQWGKTLVHHGPSARSCPVVRRKPILSAS